jgi:hypothetical protein
LELATVERCDWDLFTLDDDEVRFALTCGLESLSALEIERLDCCEGRFWSEAVTRLDLIDSEFAPCFCSRKLSDRRACCLSNDWGFCLTIGLDGLSS